MLEKNDPVNLSLVSLFVFLIVLGGCSHNISRDQDKDSVLISTNLTPYDGKANAVSKMSEDGLYKLELHSDVYPFPVNSIHNWTVRVLNPAGQPEENVKLRVYGGMPAHQHDFPTTPRVTDYLGDGYYKVEGIKFSMPGHWEMRFNIKEEEKLKRDRVVFDINL